MGEKSGDGMPPIEDQPTVEIPKHEARTSQTVGDTKDESNKNKPLGLIHRRYIGPAILLGSAAIAVGTIAYGVKEVAQDDSDNADLPTAIRDEPTKNGRTFDQLLTQNPDVILISNGVGPFLFGTSGSVQSLGSGRYTVDLLHYSVTCEGSKPVSQSVVSLRNLRDNANTVYLPLSKSKENLNILRNAREVELENPGAGIYSSPVQPGITEYIGKRVCRPGVNGSRVVSAMQTSGTQIVRPVNWEKSRPEASVSAGTIIFLGIGVLALSALAYRENRRIQNTEIVVNEAPSDQSSSTTPPKSQSTRRIGRQKKRGFDNHARVEDMTPSSEMGQEFKENVAIETAVRDQPGWDTETLDQTESKLSRIRRRFHL